MKIIAKVINKNVKMNKSRRAFKFLGKDYILATRIKKSRGYGIQRHKGLQGKRREFDQYHLGFITIYKSVDKDTLQDTF